LWFTVMPVKTGIQNFEFRFALADAKFSEMTI